MNLAAATFEQPSHLNLTCFLMTDEFVSGNQPRNNFFGKFCIVNARRRRRRRRPMFDCSVSLIFLLH